MTAVLVVALMGSVAWGCCKLLLSLCPFFSREVLKKDREPSFIPELEGLRGVLAFGVFIHHAAVTYVFFRTGEWTFPAKGLLAQLGPLAVSMFFFLTGYLFWSKARKTSRPLGVGKFFRARARRLFPTYLLVVVTILTIALAHSRFRLLESPLRILSELGHWIAFGLPFGDLPDINQMPRTIFVNANVTWTLRFEWIFYLSLPLIWWMARGKRILWLLGAGGLLVVLRLSTGGGGSNSISTALGIHTPMVIAALGTVASFFYYCAIGFGLGVLTVYLLEVSWFVRFARGSLLPVFALGALLVGVLLLPPGHGPKLSLLIFPAFVVVASRSALVRPLNSPVTQVLGAISYPLYLVHGIILFVVRAFLVHALHPADVSESIYWLAMAPTAAVVITVCALIHRWVEWPFLSVSRPTPAASPS